MTERMAECLMWLDRLPPAAQDEIADRVLWELQADAEHEHDARECATAYRPAVQVG